MIEITNSPVLTVAIYISFFSLTISLFMGMYRLLIGPTLPDRMIVLDLIASLSIGLIITYILATGQTIYLNVAVAIALLVFMGNIAFAKFLIRRIKK